MSAIGDFARKLSFEIRTAFESFSLRQLTQHRVFSGQSCSQLSPIAVVVSKFEFRIHDLQDRPIILHLGFMRHSFRNPSDSFLHGHAVVGGGTPKSEVTAHAADIPF